LITEKLPHVESMAARYLSQRLARDNWRAVGECIAAFHAKGFCHADLNAWNIQLGADDRVWILDWDRGRQLQPGKWRHANLDRLHRSLGKIGAQNSASGTGSFDQVGWDALLAGYRNAH